MECQSLKRDKGVEGCRTCDVDQGQADDDGGDEQESIKWQLKVRVNLHVAVSPAL